jgi:DNA-3-methyladenine glycosylase
MSPRWGRRLGRSFFARPAEELAPDLLGRVLVHVGESGPVAVRLTETEAYAGVGADPASHAQRGRTARNAVMFGPPGHLYVYFVYGMHWCTNVVCGPPGHAAAVLLRAGEVVEGVGLAAARRPTSRRPVDLASGPARLSLSLELDGADDGRDLCSAASAVRLLSGRPPVDAHTRSGPRVGVARGGQTQWRWWVVDDPTVSAYRPGRPAADRRGTA